MHDSTNLDKCITHVIPVMDYSSGICGYSKIGEGDNI